MRKEAKEIVGDACSESVPFSFSHKDGGEINKPAAMAYISDLWQRMQDLLESNHDNRVREHNIKHECMHIQCHVYDPSFDLAQWGYSQR